MESNFEKTTKSFMAFVSNSPSPFHVVNNSAKLLEENGFVCLLEKEKFKIQKGGKYYVTRNGSSLIAFTIPENDIKGYSIVSSHTDSPSFKIKSNPEIKKEGYVVLNTEGYGGMLLYPWFDRPLSIAGRVMVKENDKPSLKLLDLSRNLIEIVSVAIHMNRKVNDGLKITKQKEMLPLFGLGDIKLSTLIAEKLKIKESDILDSDLFLYNKTPGTIWGANKEFFSSTKIDDLQCAYSSLMALTRSEKSEYIQAICMFDNEEVGSGSKQGALSDFMISTFDRIAYNLDWSLEDKMMFKANSFMLSCDNGHAYHPNYPQFADPTNHPKINGGILIKHSANQKYTTDAVSSSYLKDLLNKKDIPFQDFENNSDIPGGSTLGNLANTHYSLDTADIGVAQLAMHSPYETGGIEDTFYLTKCMHSFFEDNR